MLTHKWDIADFFTGGGGDVGYIEKKLKSTGNPDRGTGVTPMLDGSMLSLTVADTMAYGNRAVKIRVVDTKISDSFVTHDGEYFEDEYEDEFMFNVTARRNIAPELGEDKDLGTTVTGTKKAVAVPIKKANRVAENVDSSANFIDDKDDTLTYMARSSSDRCPGTRPRTWSRACSLPGTRLLRCMFRLNSASLPRIPECCLRARYLSGRL